MATKKDAPKRVTVTLSDGKHLLTKPSFYALTFLADHGFNVAEGVNPNDPRFVAAALAALLTDSEPVDSLGEPEKVWTPASAAKLLPIESMSDIADAVKSLLFSGGDEAGEA